MTEENTQSGSGRKLTDDELDKVVGGATGTWQDDNMTGTDGADGMYGKGGDDTLSGGGGDDNLFGQAGADTMIGGEGHDYMDGGKDDGAADKAYGGEGIDKYVWGVGDGDDYFDGGADMDFLMITDLGGESSLRDAIESGGWTLQLTYNGEPIEMDPDWWNGDNALAPSWSSVGGPGEFGGVLTTPDGEKLTFDNITELSFQPNLDASR